MFRIVENSIMLAATILFMTVQAHCQCVRWLETPP